MKQIALKTEKFTEDVFTLVATSGVDDDGDDEAGEIELISAQIDDGIGIINITLVTDPDGEVVDTGIHYVYKLVALGEYAKAIDYINATGFSFHTPEELMLAAMTVLQYILVKNAIPRHKGASKPYIPDYIG